MNQGTFPVCNLDKAGLFESEKGTELWQTVLHQLPSGPENCPCFLVWIQSQGLPLIFHIGDELLAFGRSWTRNSFDYKIITDTRQEAEKSIIESQNARIP